MNIGLVLSGGMAKGAFQVGALRAISEALPCGAINLISASSVGVLNAYAFATGGLDRAEQMWKSVCSDGNRRTITQILRSSLLQSNIQRIVAEQSLNTDVFYCTLLDVRGRKVIYKNLKAIPSASMQQYLRASVAMPIYNRAVKIGDTQYFDGAMVDNIPVFPLMKHQLDYLICVYFDDTSYQFENTYFDNKIIKITFPSQTLVSQSLYFREEGIQAMVSAGYSCAEKILRRVLSEGWDNTPEVYQKIVEEEAAKKRVIRVTGDLLVTNLNRVAQKLTARKIEL